MLITIGYVESWNYIIAAYKKEKMGVVSITISLIWRNVQLYVFGELKSSRAAAVAKEIMYSITRTR